MSKSKTGIKLKKKIKKQILEGRVYIQATFNNTIVTITDIEGNVLSWSSAGSMGFKGTKKSSPYVASLIAQEAYNKAKIYGLEKADIYVKGVGRGRDLAVRALDSAGLFVKSLKDITPIPHNGCRAKKIRRV